MIKFETLNPQKAPLIHSLFEALRASMQHKTDVLFHEQAWLTLCKEQVRMPLIIKSQPEYAELCALAQEHMQGKADHSQAGCRTVALLRQRLDAGDPEISRGLAVGLGAFVAVFRLLFVAPDVHGKIQACLQAGLSEGYYKFRNEHGVQTNVRLSGDVKGCFFAYGPLTAEKLKRLERSA